MVKLISGLTIFLIFVIIMTLFTFGTYKYTENMTRKSCGFFPYMESVTKMDTSDYCVEMVEFHTVRSRITQYASMILICLLMLSFKVDKIERRLK